MPTPYQGDSNILFVLRRCKGMVVCVHRQDFDGKKAKKGGFIDTYQFLFVPLSPLK
jgi:hypothetical protein